MASNASAKKVRQIKPSAAARASAKTKQKASPSAPRRSVPKARRAKVGNGATALPPPKKEGAPSPAASAPDSAKNRKPIRDSFTMPRPDFQLIDALKRRALAFGRPTKKSEILRAGLHALAAMDNALLARTLAALAVLKPGRPKSDS